MTTSHCLLGYLIPYVMDVENSLTGRDGVVQLQLTCMKVGLVGLKYCLSISKCTVSESSLADLRSRSAVIGCIYTAFVFFVHL